MIKKQNLLDPVRVRELTIAELEGEAGEITEHLMKLRFQLASGQIEDPQLIRVYRRGLARVKTILAEKKRAGEGG